MKAIATAVALILSSAATHAQVGHNIYFAGATKHVKPGDKTREGNMDLLGYSMRFRVDGWLTEPGINTYVDSYSKRSYTAFVDISHDNFA